MTSTLALALMPGHLYVGTDTRQLRQQVPTAPLLITSPVDLAVAARLKTGGVINELIKEFSPTIAAQLSLGNRMFNNPAAWFKALVKVAERVKGTPAIDAYLTAPEEEHMTDEQPTAAPAQDAPAQQEEHRAFTRKSIAGKLIILKTEINPKRKSSEAYKIFQLYFDHGGKISVEKFFELGGRLCDVKCDVEKGYVTLEEGIKA